MGLSQFLTPNVRAMFAVLFTAFIGAFFGYVQTQLEQGIPPQNQWAHILGAAAVVGLVAAYHRWKPDPATVASAGRAVTMFAFACLAGLVAIAVAACTPAQQASWQRVPVIVEADLEAGKSFPQIENDVAADLVGTAGPVLVSIIDDVITYLLDSGALSDIGQKNAIAMKPAIAAKKAALHITAMRVVE